MDILNELVSRAKFPQLAPLEADNATEEVLETFYACWLAMMADAKLARGYQQFVKETSLEAMDAMTAGGLMPSTAHFLTKNSHDKIAKQLAQYSFVNEAQVMAVLPLAVHHGWQVLSAKGNPHQLAVSAYDEIRQFLPTWASTALPRAALHPVPEQTHTTLEYAIDDLANEAVALNHGNVDTPVAVSAVIGEDFAEFDEFDRGNPYTSNLAGSQTKNQINSQTQNQTNDQIHKPNDPSQSAFTHPINPSFGEQGGLANTSIDRQDVHNQNVHHQDVHSQDVHSQDVHSQDVHSQDIHNQGIHNQDTHNPFAHNISATPTSDKTDDEADNEADEVNTDTAFVAPPRTKKRISPVMYAVPLVLFGVLAGVAYYYLKAKTADTGSTVATVPTPTVINKPTAQINITVGEQGELYACQAELGGADLQNQLMSVLNNSFHTTTCVLDVDDSFNAKLTGMDKLPSIIALLKSVRFASLEMSEGRLLIFSPNADDTARLVQDISALVQASGIQVAAMPTYNPNELVADSISRGTEALNALPNNADGFLLARAMSLPRIDFGQGMNIPEVNQPLLDTAATKLIANPNIRLIVVAHTSGAKDSANEQLANERANTVRNYLIAQGVPEGQLIAQGAGARFPVADNETDFGRFKNSRVEFLEYNEAIMQVLSAPVAPPVTMGNQELSQGAVLYSAPVETADTAIYNEVQSEQAQVPNTTPPANAPVFGVQNGQIVQESQSYDNGLPQGITPAPSSSGLSGIDEELFNPIGSDPVGAPASQLQ